MWNLQAVRQISHSNIFCTLNDAIHWCKRASREPVAEQACKHHQEWQKFFFDQPEMVERLIERLRGHRCADHEFFATGSYGLLRNAILQLRQVGGQVRDSFERGLR